MARQATFKSGWAQAPAWFKGFALTVAAINIALLGFAMATFSMSPLFWAVVLLVNAGVLFALIGTVTDVFAAPADLRTEKLRSLAIGIGLVVLVVTFFAATLIRLGGNVFNRVI